MTTTMSCDQTFKSRFISYIYGKAKSKFYRLYNRYIESDPNDMHELFPRIYISDLKTSLSEYVLDQHGITHVISAVVGTDNEERGDRECVYFPLMDNTSEDINSYFLKCNEYISRVLAENETNRILVHCMVGASRSATLIAAFMCATTGHSISDILEGMKSKRDIVCPNPYFLKQLHDYEKVLCGEII